MRLSLSGLFTTITLLALGVLGFVAIASASDAGLQKTGSGRVTVSGGATWSGGTIMNNGVIIWDNGGAFEWVTGESAVRRMADFENYPLGVGKLLAPGFLNGNGLSGAATVGEKLPDAMLTDPLQGIAISSPLGTGRAAYLEPILFP